MIADLCKWNTSAKLVHLTTRLKGQAFAFYRSCAPRQKADYDSLVTKLKKRFTPVRIQAIQMSHFHERRQKAGESVDSFAQDLRGLYHKAYPSTSRGSKETEEMGQTILANQFATGLLPELKAKVGGSEGDLEKLLTKARFEEAKLRYLQPQPAQKKPAQTPVSKPVEPKQSMQSMQQSWTSAKSCFNCGSKRHLAYQCPEHGRSKPVESRSKHQPHKRQNNNVATLLPQAEDCEQLKEKVAELRRQLQEAERSLTISEVATCLHRIEVEPREVQLGPVLTVVVQMEGVPVRALIDTGSPATIVDLEFLVNALAKTRESDQSPPEWMAAVEKRFQPPGLPLKSYGGHKLNLVGQLQVTLTRGNHTTDAVIQVQKDAPVQLLLGTDLQPLPGFSFLMEDECETMDLLQKEQPSDCVVRLVKAVCVPANHMKMIEAQAIGCGERSAFQPVQKLIEQHGLQMADAIVEPGEAGKMTLIVENHSHQPIDLENSYVLGCLHPVERVLPDDRAQEKKGKIVQYAFTDWGMPADGRAVRIMEAIGLNKSELTSEEQSRLESLICQYQNLFALSRLTWGLQSSSLTVYTLVTTLLSPSHCVTPFCTTGEDG